MDVARTLGVTLIGNAIQDGTGNGWTNIADDILTAATSLFISAEGNTLGAIVKLLGWRFRISKDD